jgi:hypothetical protein
MVQQDVALPDRAEHVAVRAHELRRQAGTERREFQVGALHLVGHVDEPGEVDRPVHAVEVFLAQVELREEVVRDLLRAVVGDLEPHLVAELAVRKLAAQRGAQVLDLLLVHEQLAVARDAELVAVDHLHAGEELRDVGVQHRGQEHEIVLGVGFLARQPDDPRQHARRLHDGDAGIAAECVLAFQLDGEVQALVQHAREGVRGVEADRGQDRHHLAQEVGLDPVRLGGSEVGPAQEADALGREPRQDLRVEQLVLLGHQLVRLLRHLPEDELRVHAVGADDGSAGFDLGLQAGDADLEELVEVGGDDAQEPQPLEERRGAVLRLRQHAPVERELADLAVEEQLRDVAWLVHRIAAVRKARAVSAGRARRAGSSVGYGAAPANGRAAERSRKRRPLPRRKSASPSAARGSRAPSCPRD